jgi:hypothetical protein
MFLKTLLSSIFLVSLATQTAAFPLNQNDKRASYSVVNVDGSNGGSDPTGGFQTVTQTVIQTLLQTTTLNAVTVTVTVTQTPTATPYDNGLWHPPYYKVADPSSPQTASAPSTTTSSVTTFLSSAPPVPTIVPIYRNTTQ